MPDSKSVQRSVLEELEQNELANLIDEHELWNTGFDLPKARLAALMSNISEDTMFASWLHDNEYCLWSAVLMPENHCLGGRHDYSREDIDKLKPLSDECGGWIVWDDTTLRRFVPIAEWLPMYADWWNREAKRGSL